MAARRSLTTGFSGWHWTVPVEIICVLIKHHHRAYATQPGTRVRLVHGPWPTEECYVSLAAARPIPPVKGSCACTYAGRSKISEARTRRYRPFLHGRRTGAATDGNRSCKAQSTDKTPNKYSHTLMRKYLVWSSIRKLPVFFHQNLYISKRGSKLGHPIVPRRPITR
jgi:hypothetical protein